MTSSPAGQYDTMTRQRINTSGPREATTNSKSGAAVAVHIEMRHGPEPKRCHDRDDQDDQDGTCFGAPHKPHRSTLEKKSAKNIRFVLIDDRPTKSDNIRVNEGLRWK